MLQSQSVVVAGRGLVVFSVASAVAATTAAAGLSHRRKNDDRGLQADCVASLAQFCYWLVFHAALGGRPTDPPILVSHVSSSRGKRI